MTTQKNNFLELVEAVMRDSKKALMRPVIEKELLHYDILFALDKNHFLDKLTFQGGTSLRLCYGSQRFSEDLDFAGGQDFKAIDIMPIKQCLEEYLVNKYALQVTVKGPKDMILDPNTKNINVSKWQIQVITHPERKSIPRQMIKIEVANIPYYTREPKRFISNYSILPDGYNELIIMTQSLDEIFADKIVAFVDCQSYIRHRDIWDMHWLQRQGAQVNLGLINKKIIDHNVIGFIEKLELTKQNLPNIVMGKEFIGQMSRFLPADVIDQTLGKPSFLSLLLQWMLQLYNDLGFEFRIGEGGAIYCTNSLLNLEVINLESIISQMQQRIKDKYNSLILLSKKPVQLIVSADNEYLAKQIYNMPQNAILLVEGYKVDADLLPSQWAIKFI